MGVSLHILNAAGILSPLEAQIQNGSNEAIKAISTKIKIPNIDIAFFDNPRQTIPEIGLGGYTPTASLVFVSIDHKHPEIKESINNYLKRTIAHEIYHCVRWNAIGYEETLLEALVSEGLADNFDLEINGGELQPWSKALGKSQIEKYLSRAKDEFNNKNYDHDLWFFGSKEKEIPRWTGYSIGFYIVKKYTDKNPQKKPSSIYMKNTNKFLK